MTNIPSKQTISLPTIHADLLRQIAADDGLIHVTDWSGPVEKKAVRALVRVGMLSCGSTRGSGWHHVTDHGRQWLARAEQESPR